MALGTSTLIAQWENGNKRERIFDIVGAASYTTGGDALTAKSLGMNAKVYFASVAPKTPAGYVAQYDHTNSKLAVYQQKDPAAVGGADTALVEVASTTDLSGVTFRVRAVGR